MKPISRRMPSVVVEYDCRGRRKQKTFTDAFYARRFYVKKLLAGRRPKLRGIS